MASAPSAAFIHKTMFLWVALMAGPFLGERLGWAPIAALGVLLLGQVLTSRRPVSHGAPARRSSPPATRLWAIEVVLARRLLVADVPAPVLGAARLGIGMVVLLAYLAVSGRLPILVGLTATQLAWGLATGALLAGYTATWLGALRRADASVVASVLVLGAPVTAALSAAANGTVPAPTVVLGQGTIAIAVLALLILARRSGSGDRWPRPDVMISTDVPGPVRFARYAYGPNRLGYCGPDAADELLGEAAAGGDLRMIRELAMGFEGAWPYLELIARANGIDDPLDGRVVEAYWLGGDLLDAVPASTFARSNEIRFRPRVRPSSWRWLATKAPGGAHPVHAFHVLDVFPVVGLLRGGPSDDVLGVIDHCRIRWGVVRDRIGADLLVDAVPLEWADGKLRLGAPRTETVRGWTDGLGFIDEPAAGDDIAIHWDWACERLDARRLQTLKRWTARELAIANLTL